MIGFYRMRKLVFVSLFLLSGCATSSPHSGYSEGYPLCAALPSGVLGCR